MDTTIMIAQQSGRTTSQRCLQISEVQLLIFEEIASENSDSSLQTLASLARTSKMFSDQALDFLWTTQGCLRPLTNCLPEDLVSINIEEDSVRKNGFQISHMSFRRQLCPADLDRFWFYAKRIITLNDNFSWPAGHISLPHITPDALQALIDFVRTPLLPNLRFHESLVCSLAHTPYLLGPNVASFHLGYTDFSTAEYASFFPRLCTACPNITTVSIVNRIGTKTLNNFICGLVHLETLEVGDYTIYPRTLLHLASLPNLTTVDVVIGRQSLKGLIPLTLPQHAFASLTYLDVAFDDAETCIKFISSARFEQIKHIKIEIEEVEPQIVKKIATALASSVSQTSLTMLSLELDLDDDGFEVPKDALQPLRVFSNMKYFTFTCDSFFALDDASLEELVYGWPQLVRMHFYLDEFSWDDASVKISNLTSRALLLLAKYCPQLESLKVHIHLDAQNVEVETEGIVNKSLKILELENSHLTDVKAIAKFLTSTFPELRVDVPNDNSKDLLELRNLVNSSVS